MMKWFGKLLFKTLGWELEGRYPSEIPKKILIVGPHTAKIDFVIGMSLKFWLDIKGDWYGKKELFRGVQGILFRILSGHPVDRERHQNLVDQVVSIFNSESHHTIVIAPEGTRKKVSKFKTGFYYMALGAHVPIIPIIFDFGTKKVRILNAIWVKGLENEIEQIEDLFRGIKGKYVEKSF